MKHFFILSIAILALSATLLATLNINTKSKDKSYAQAYFHRSYLEENKFNICCFHNKKIVHDILYKDTQITSKQKVLVPQLTRPQGKEWEFQGILLEELLATLKIGVNKDSDITVVGWDFYTVLLPRGQDLFEYQPALVKNYKSLGKFTSIPSTLGGNQLVYFNPPKDVSEEARYWCWYVAGVFVGNMEPHIEIYIGRDQEFVLVDDINIKEKAENPEGKYFVLFSPGIRKRLDVPKGKKLLFIGLGEFLARMEITKAIKNVTIETYLGSKYEVIGDLKKFQIIFAWEDKEKKSVHPALGGPIIFHCSSSDQNIFFVRSIRITYE